MEFLSASQLHKYEDIIYQIQSEFGKYEELKKELDEENNKAVVSHLADNKLSEKVSHVNIKIFNDLIDLLNLYSGELEEDIYKLMKYDNCKYYLLEVYVSKPLIQKIKNLNSLLHFSIKTDRICINKTLNLGQKLPVLKVIPVDANIVNCVIETRLMFPSDSNWMLIKLDTIHVDISYHFQKDKEKRKQLKNKTILQITKCYNETLNIEELIRSPLLLEYKLMCNVEKSTFIQTVLKNSYHKLDIELFSHFESDTDFVLQFSNGLEKCNLTYNNRDKILTLRAKANDLCLLKKYFLKAFHCQDPLDRDSVMNLKLKENVPEDSQEATHFYRVLRNTWLQLPM